MKRRVDDLVTEEVLMFTPLVGKFDVETVAQALAGIGFSYRDEVNPNAFAVFSRADARDAFRSRRKADLSSTFPSVLRVSVKPEELLIYPVSSQDDLRMLSENFLGWVVETYESKIFNNFGTDIT